MKSYFTALAVSFAAIGLLFISCAGPEDQSEIIFTGDLLLDRGVRKQIELKGADHLFTKVRARFLRCDAVFANLECPVTAIQAPIYKKYVFRGEPEWLQNIKNAGITHLILSNNHTYDQGRKGLKDTYQNILRGGLNPVGYGDNHRSACEPQIIRLGEGAIGLFTSVMLKLEGWPFLPDSANFCQATTDELAENIRNFRYSWPDVPVIVSLHWGLEHVTEPSPQQKEQARRLVDAGADLIIGHHPHVIQGMEIYKGRKIWYSLGNFVFDQQKSINSDAWMVRVLLQGNSLFSDSIPIRITHCVPEMIQ